MINREKEMTLKEVIKKEMVERLGISEGNFELAMAEPVATAAKRAGIESATDIVDRVISSFPPEIVSRGKVAISVFFEKHGYEGQKELLMEAVEGISNEKEG